MRVSYLEIYNESIRDLLNFKKNLKDDEKPVIHTDKVSNNTITLIAGQSLCSTAIRVRGLDSARRRRPTGERQYIASGGSHRLGEG